MATSAISRIGKGTSLATLAGMRFLGLTLLLFSGCVTATSAERIALATIPGTPEALSGGSGVGLAVRTLTGEPEAQPEGGAVALPAFQPELGAVLRMDKLTRLNFKLSLAPPGVAKSPPGFRTLPNDTAAMELVFGAARDLPFSRLVGAVLGGELGASVVSLTELGTYAVVQPTARAAVGLYVEPGPVRLFGAVTVGTGTWNDAASVVTRNCSLLVVCTETSTGHLGLTGVALAGGGVRWQIGRLVAVAAEGWMPLTVVATRIPFTVGLTVRIGEFDIEPYRKPASSPRPGAPGSAAPPSEAPMPPPSEGPATPPPGAPVPPPSEAPAPPPSEEPTPPL